MPWKDSKDTEKECGSFLENQQRDYPQPTLNWIGDLQRLEETKPRGNYCMFGFVLTIN